METKYYTRQNLIAGFIIGLLIGLGGYYLVDNSGSLKINKNDDSHVEDTSSGEMMEGDKDVGEAMFETSSNTVSVSDQPAGFQVMLGSFTLAQDGWVVIHEDNNGKPGNILGAARFDAGSYEGGEVDLLRNTEEGSVYYAMLHKGDGDKEFDLTKDTPVFNSQDNPVMVSFNVIRIH